MATNPFEIGMLFRQIIILFRSHFRFLLLQLDFYATKANSYDSGFTRDARAANIRNAVLCMLFLLLFCVSVRLSVRHIGVSINNISHSKLSNYFTFLQ